MKNVLKKMRKHVKKNVLSGLIGVVGASYMLKQNVYATSAITAPLDNLKTLVVAVIGAVGVIILAKNTMEFAQAYQAQDSSSMNSAIKGMIAGVIMASISAVISFLGF